MIKTTSHNYKNEHTNLSLKLNKLPLLPNIIRYNDDFDEKIQTIRDFQKKSSCVLFVNGSNLTIDFHRYPNDSNLLVKHLFVYCLVIGLSIGSISSYLISLYHLNYEDFITLVTTDPFDIKTIWAQFLTKDHWTRDTYSSLKILLTFLARNNLSGWSTSYYDFISASLPLPLHDKYAAVRSGNVFLNIQEEASIVNYLDTFAISLRDKNKPICLDALKNTGMLVCSFQFGMRPIQIASLRLRDVKVWKEMEENAYKSVHLTFKIKKQSLESKSYPLVRKVKPEWTPIIVELYQNHIDNNLHGSCRIFGAESSQKAGLAIRNIVTRIAGRNITATDLRHTAAQRMVDAGANKEELAEFMGHTETKH